MGVSEAYMSLVLVEGTLSASLHADSILGSSRSVCTAPFRLLLLPASLLVLLTGSFWWSV